MPYLHGVYINEDQTPIIAPLQCDSAIQVVIGAAPVNMALDIPAAVNRPVLVNSFTEAVKRVGYSDDFSKYTICQSVDASFRLFNVAPMVLINVLDPEKHMSSAADQDYALCNRRLTVFQDGVMLDTVEVKGDGTELKSGIDFSTTFDDGGNLVIFTEDDYDFLNVSYSYLDPALVTELDIIGGYSASTGVYKGLELIDQIYPRLGIVPGQILAPGWSFIPAVNAVITSKLTNINMSFKCMGVSDINTNEANTYDKVLEWKNANGYVNENLEICWPKTQVGEKVYF
ncbi:MAG: phage tail sheath family protein, partial [Clostridiales bacterium]|nr:phage tail sheath family protein [Clostridiales bacterium]